MSDHRGDDGRDDDVEQSGGPDAGGSDWLLDQLTGGRRIERPEAAHRSAVPAPHHDVDEEELDGIDDLAAAPEAPGLASPDRDPSAAPAEPTPPTTAFTSPVEVAPGGARGSGPAAGPAGDFEELLSTPPVEPERFEPLEEEVPVSFSWHLKPDSAVVDPLVAPADDMPTPAAPFVPPTPASDAPAAPEAPSVPPVPTYTPPTEPYSSPVVSGPTDVIPPTSTPPVDVPDTTGAYVPPTPPSGWSIPSPAAEPAQPEPERPGATNPTRDDEDEQSGEGHGFAALLGLFEPEAPEEKPSGRSVIGDTTSVIPIPPQVPQQPPADPAGAVTAEPQPHPAPAWPESSTPAAPVFPPPAVAPPAFPAAFAAPQPPAEPVLPPPHASALFEPTAETPTRKLDTSEIAALLNAKTGDPDPDADRPFSDDASPRRRAAAEPVAEPTQEAPAEPSTFPAPGVAGGAFTSGAAATEAVLGAPPSPATSPIDAQSIAAASDATAEPTSQPPFAAHDPEPGDDEDGIAALFGADAPIIEVADDSDEFGAEPVEPGYAAAEVEGPQLSATSPLFVPAGEAPARPPVEEAPAEQVVPDQAPVLPPAPPLFTPLASAARTGSAASAPEAFPAVAAPPVSSAGPGTADADRPTADRPTPFLPSPPGEGPAGPGGPGGGGPSSGRPGGPHLNRTILLIAGGVAVVLVLIGLFALGTRLPSLFSSAPQPQSTRSAAATPRPTPSVTATPVPVQSVVPKPAGPAAAGTQRWDALGGGECVQPYTTPWAETFTVVDCGSSHTAQMVYTNLVNTDPNAAYPGADALAQQINGLCTATGVIDLSAAAAYPDLQVQGTFPATQQQWASGQRSYYCFASRSSGKPMTSSVAGPGPGH